MEKPISRSRYLELFGKLKMRPTLVDFKGMEVVMYICHRDNAWWPAVLLCNDELIRSIDYHNIELVKKPITGLNLSFLPDIHQYFNIMLSRVNVAGVDCYMVMHIIESKKGKQVILYKTPIFLLVCDEVCQHINWEKFNEMYVY